MTKSGNSSRAILSDPDLKSRSPQMGSSVAPVRDIDSTKQAKVVEVAPALPDPTFPILSGWDIMSRKHRKKLLKIWHNRVRSGALGSSEVQPRVNH